MRLLRLIVGLLALSAAFWGIAVARQRSVSDWTKPVISAAAGTESRVTLEDFKLSWQSRPLNDGKEARALELRYLNALGRYAKLRRGRSDFDEAAKFWRACVKEHERRFPE